MTKESWQAENKAIHEGQVIAEHKRGNVIACEKCGFSHIIPLPDPKDLEKFYEEEFYQNEKPDYISKATQDEKWINLTHQDKFDLIEKHFGNAKGKALDIGSGPGGFLLGAKDNGWEALGIEPSKPAVDHCQSLGLNVTQGFFSQKLANTLGKFDLIHLSKVLEHLPNPVEILKTALGLLKPDGLIVITVPNDFNPFQDALIKSGNFSEWWVVPDHHFNYFNYDTLEALLEKEGAIPIERYTDFPMDMFLLMGDDYTKTPELGGSLHKKRKTFDLTLENNQATKTRQTFYKSLARAGLGRNATVVAKKPNKNA